MRYLTGWVVGLGLMTAAAGCGNDDAVGNNPAIAMTTSKATMSIAQGGTDNLVATITRTDFTGTITVEASAIPTGVTVTVSNVTTVGSTTTGTVTLVVGATVTPGVYPMTVKASGSGVTDATVALALTVTAAPAIGLALTPGTLSVVQLATGATNVAITRTNYTGAVAFALEGAPAGVTGAFAPSSATDNASVLTITVGAAVATGTYNLTVRGTGAGVADAVATLALTTGPSSYVLGPVTPDPVPVPQGANGALTVPIARTNFTGTVNLTLEGMPAGVTGGFVPAAVTGTTSALTVSVGNAVPAADYTLTVRGTTPGRTDQTATFVLHVTAVVSGGNTSLDYAACSASTKPVWLAVQDGVGANWTAVTGVNNVFNFNLTQPKVGIATAVSGGSGDAVTVAYWTKAEAQALTAGQLCSTPATKSLTALTQNLTATQSALVALGGGFGAASFGAPTATISGVANGVFDLVGYARDLVTPGTSDRVIIRRDINTTPIAAAGSIGAALDFQGAESFAPSTATMVVNGAVGGETVLNQMFYLTGSACTTAALYAGAQGLVAYGVPAGQQRASDYHGLTILATAGTVTSGTTRTVIDYFHTFGVRTNTLPSLIPALAPVSLAGPYKRLQFQFTMPSDLAGSATAEYVETSGGTDAVVMIASAGYLGGTAVDLTFPDFTGVGTWQNSYAPSSSATGSWMVAGGAGTGLPCTGATLLASSRAGSF